MLSGIPLPNPRAASLVFWAGVVAVTLGVVPHVPMYLMARSMGYRLAGIEMDGTMFAGMVCILLGTLATGFSLLRPAVAAAADLSPLHAGEGTARTILSTASPRAASFPPVIPAFRPSPPSPPPRALRVSGPCRPPPRSSSAPVRAA